MTPVKNAVIKMIQKMPVASSVSDIMAELYFREKVNKGMEDIKKGRTVSHGKAKERFKKWLK